MLIQRNHYKISNTKMFTLNFGPRHPAAHGALRLVLELGGRIFERIALVGGLMRCFFLIIPQEQYSVILTFFSITVLLSGVMILLPYIFSKRNSRDSEKISEYECGFEPFDSATRQPFTVHFYIVGILFLIFDVEMALLFPWSVILQSGA